MVSGSVKKKEVDRTFEKIEKKKKKKKSHDIYFQIAHQLSKRLDDRIYLNKYYPWCYKNYIPTVALQGWYNRKEAKQIYKLFYGPTALKHIRFIKGRNAIAKNFSIGKTVYIDGMWRPVKNKEFTPFSIYSKQECNKRVREKSLTGKSIIASGAVGKKRKEKILIQEVKVKLGDHGISRIIPKVKHKKKLRVSKVQEIIQERKNSLYE
jgi:hypothetical protein